MKRLLFALLFFAATAFGQNPAIPPVGIYAQSPNGQFVSVGLDISGYMLANSGGSATQASPVVQNYVPPAAMTALSPTGNTVYLKADGNGNLYINCVVGCVSSLTSAQIQAAVGTNVYDPYGAATTAQTNAEAFTTSQLTGYATTASLSGYALLSGNLTQFASTTSAQLASIITDETGTGVVVYSISPALTGTPTAPTKAITDNNTEIATTAAVTSALAGAINPTSTGQTTPGPGAFTTATATSGFQVIPDGIHAQYSYWTGNTANQSVVANSFGIMGPTSATFTAYALQMSSTAPSSGTPLLSCGTPSSSVAACTWVAAGGSITWPTSADIVLSNGTSSPAGLAPVNGDCVVGSGGAWTAGSCGSSTAWSSITAGTNTATGAFATAGTWTFSAAGAASTPGLSITGAPYTGGSTTTNFPQFYINDGTGPSTFSSAGTAFGINAPSAFAGNLMDFHLNGGASVASLTIGGGWTGVAFNTTAGTISISNNSTIRIAGTAGVISFSSNGLYTGTADTGISRSAAGILAVGNGTQADFSGIVKATTYDVGIAGTAGTIIFGNATSGTVTLGTVTGALGTVTASLPANTGTIAELNLAQTFSATQTVSNLVDSGLTSGDCVQASTSGLLANAASACGVTGGTLAQFASTTSAQLATILSDETGTGVVVYSIAPSLSGAVKVGATGVAGSIVFGNATSGTVTLQTLTGALGSVTASLPTNTGTIAELNLAQTWTATQTVTNFNVGVSGTLGTIIFGNATSGTITLEPVTGALGSVTASLPANTGTVAELNLAQSWTATQTFSNISETTANCLAAAVPIAIPCIVYTNSATGLTATSAGTTQTLYTSSAPAGASFEFCPTMFQNTGTGSIAGQASMNITWTTVAGSSVTAATEANMPFQSGGFTGNGTCSTVSTASGSTLSFIMTTSGGTGTVTWEYTLTVRRLR